jgi:hypothetical protein
MSSGLPKLQIQQTLQSEDDTFSGTPTQSDDPADNNGHLSMPPTLAPPSAQSKICISEQTIQKMCKTLHSIIKPGDDDARILEAFRVVFLVVRGALEEDPNLKARLANEDQFNENVKQKDEQQFINLLRDIVTKESWRDLLQNGTSCSLFRPQVL